MKIILTCSECGHQEWGQSEGTLMNKIKMWNHAVREHKDSAKRVVEMSTPKYSFAETLQSA
jgi:hypothetical protein